jgi:tetratricopeptide (TPR) repeat protein
LTCGCGVDRQIDSHSDVRAANDTPLPRFTPPDLTGVSESARQQLKAAYDVVERARQDSATPPGDLAAAHGALAKLLLAAKLRGSAELALRHAQALAESDFRWPYYLGHVHRENGDPLKASASFERAARLRSDHAPSWIWLARAEFDAGRAVNAEQHFQRALSLDASSVPALYGLGQVALAKRDYPQALQYLERAIARDGSSAPVHYALALAYRGSGQLARAEEHLRPQAPSGGVRVTDPLMDELETLLQTATAHEIRGSQALERSDWGLAADNFRKAIELAPDDPSLRHKLATALALKGDAAEAVRHFEEIARRWPGFSKGQYSLGLVLASNGRLDEAADRFRAAVNADPADAKARLQLAEVLRISGQTEAALREYDQAIERDPRLQEATFGRAMALVRLARYTEARDRLLEAMMLFPEQPRFAHATARLLAAAPDDQARDGRRALSILDGLLATRQTSIALAETVAMAFAEVGQYEQATVWQRDAIAGADKAGLSDVLPRMSANLTLYEQRKPCRLRRADERPFTTL